VEAILQSKLTPNKRGVRYLIKWKGYPDSENTWEPPSNLTNAPDLLKAFHKKYPKMPRNPVTPIRMLQAQQGRKEGILSRTVTSEIAEPAKTPVKVARVQLPYPHDHRHSVYTRLLALDSKRNQYSKQRLSSETIQGLTQRLEVARWKGLRRSLSALPGVEVGWLESHDIVWMTDRSSLTPSDRSHISELTCAYCGAAVALLRTVMHDSPLDG
jgi:hypothetical protein